MAHLPIFESEPVKTVLMEYQVPVGLMLRSYQANILLI